MTASPALYQRRRSKYGAIPTTVGTRRFASKAEAKRYQELLLLQQAGEIRGLRCQVSYDLPVNGFLVCRYRADFVYEEKSSVALRCGRYDYRAWVPVTEDVKSPATITPLYKLKRALMKAVHGIDIREVSA